MCRTVGDACEGLVQVRCQHGAQLGGDVALRATCLEVEQAGHGVLLTCQEPSFGALDLGIAHGFRLKINEKDGKDMKR